MNGTSILSNTTQHIHQYECVPNRVKRDHYKTFHYNGGSKRLV
jgi:hypothetical protein